MFFRLKHSKSGQVLQLLESYRNSEGKPRQRVVVSLGDAGISRPDWGPIAKAVQKQLYGIEELLAPQYTRRQQNWIELIVRRIDGGGDGGKGCGQRGSQGQSSRTESMESWPIR